MNLNLYPMQTKALSDRRRDLAPDAEASFRAFSKAVFQDGALSRKTKQLIAFAVAHVTQYPFCIQGHTKAAAKEGALPDEIMEAIWVAAEIRAGAAYAHSWRHSPRSRVKPLPTRVAHNPSVDSHPVAPTVEQCTFAPSG